MEAQSRALVQNDPFPFLRLPAELRNMVYSLLFHLDVKDPVIIMYYGPKPTLRTKAQRREWRVKPVPLVPSHGSSLPHGAIMRTSKEIFLETIGLLSLAWSRTHLDLSLLVVPGPALRPALSTVGGSLLKQLQYVVMDVGVLSHWYDVLEVFEMDLTFGTTIWKGLTLEHRKDDNRWTTSDYIIPWSVFTGRIPAVTHSLKIKTDSDILNADSILDLAAKRDARETQHDPNRAPRLITLQNGYLVSTRRNIAQNSSPAI